MGFSYSYVAQNVTNGFEYWYTLTAYSLVDAQGLFSSHREEPLQKT